MRSMILALLLVARVSTFAEAETPANPVPECFDQVLITGYYIPELKDFDPLKSEEIKISAVSRTNTMRASWLLYV